ncbi:MAG TPA: hypothetical protein VGL77_11935 [Armatimonadota bacterium]|jgi:TM2 domain-containing membrane protein YozV
MLSRWYSIFLGIMLLILGIAGLVAPRLVTGAGTTATLVTTSVFWLITAVIALWFGFAVRSVNSLRWFAGVVGAIYLLWGIAALVATGRTAAASLNVAGVLATMSGFMVLLGALGLAAALAPAYWLREHEMYAPSNA